MTMKKTLMTMKKTLNGLTLLIAVLAAVNLPAAQWTGNGSTSAWNDTGNWQGGTMPGATDVAEFSSDASVTLTADCAASCITNTSASQITLTLTADTDVRLAASICGAIAVEKRGAGTISLAARQSYTGATRIVEGSLSTAPDLSLSDYKAYGTLSLHLDASHSETILTDANGYVTEWKSLTDNGMTTYGAAVSHASATLYSHESPYLETDSFGRTTVQFGWLNDGVHTRTNTFISAASGGAPVQFQARTFFLVQRELYPTALKTYGLLGMITGYSFRFYRSKDFQYGWNPLNMDESWCNGRKSTGASDNTYTSSGLYNANLLVVRRSELGKFDIIGNQYLMKNATTSMDNNEGIPMQLYEVLLFDEALTDAQIEDVSALLMKKWAIPEQAVCLNDSLLPAGSSFSVAAGATLECGDPVQTLSEVSGSGTFKADGLLDLKGGTLKVGGDMRVSGSGEITNTVAQKATLVVSNDTSATLSVHLSGNLDLEKQGAGVLWVAGEQRHNGETRLNGGKTVAELDCQSYGTLSLHLDVSHLETIVTNASGYLTEWKSLTDNGMTTYGAAVSHASATLYSHESPFLETDPLGRRTVQFGWMNDGVHTRTNSFISAACNGENVQFQARTFFLVQRELYANKADSYGLLGMITGYSFRFYRSASIPYGWAIENMDESWCNGRKSTGASDNTYTSSGDLNANLLVVRRSELGKFDIIGNQYLMKNATTPNLSSISASNPMQLYEVLLYDEALTDSQIEEISAFLMKKWDVPQQAVAPLSFAGSFAPTSVFSVLADSALDFSAYAPQMQALKTVSLSSSTFPVLTFAGDWDVTTLPLIVEEPYPRSRGVFLRTTGSLTSPFVSVTGAPADRLRYTANEAYLRSGGGLVLSFR